MTFFTIIFDKNVSAEEIEKVKVRPPTPPSQMDSPHVTHVFQKNWSVDMNKADSH